MKLTSKIFLIPVFYLFFLVPLLAQTGKIRGTVIEDATGEPLFSVTVVIAGTTNGSVTDFDGKFEISAAPGVYDLQISFVSFKTVKITGLEVQAGEVTIIDQIRLQESVEELEAVVVTAEVAKTTEAALMTVKRKSANLIDGISAANFSKIGDSDAAGAIKRVTGVSVEGGKYVYVRGLGDRYTKTTLNNVDIPGLDPDRNSLQMDIFPTNLIDNMLVLKSAVAEMPADFTGGVVNIETKDFPDERLFDVSVSVGYNPYMHFNNDYISYKGGNSDYLGFDDGTRALPAAGKQELIPSPENATPSQEVNSFLKKFSPTLGVKNQTSFMDYSLGVSYADQKVLKSGGKLGYVLSASYKNSTKFYDNVQYGEYQRLIDPSEYELRYATVQNGVIGENNVLLGGLGGLAYKTKNMKLKLTLMHLQNGESKSGQFFVDNDGQAVGQSGYTAGFHNLEYNQRALTNILLNGEHYVDETAWKIDWRISPTLSNITDPDIRKTTTTYKVNGDSSYFDAGAGGNPSRIWRYLNEINLVGKIDVTREYSLFGEEAKLKFGMSHVYKQRDYEILSFNLKAFGSEPDYNSDPNTLLVGENLYPEGKLYLQAGNPSPNPNEYNSNVHNTGIYVSNEFNPTERLKAILGLRAESYVQRHTGRDATYQNVLDNDKVLDAVDFFPSTNFIYALTDQQNIRVSYSKTIARPSFKELSYAQILDPLTNRIFNGGLFSYSDWDGKLSETRINNYDIRWELFMKRGELVSVSGFYKSFDDPIELVRIPEQQTSTEYQPRNVGDGQMVGVEIELRKSLGFVASSLEYFSVSGNFTFVKSQIDMTVTEFNSRKNYEKEGQNIKNTRQMAGQAPYILNGGLSYDNPKYGLDAGFFYNVKGPTLTIVGGGLFPDVYTEPFHSLNFNFNKSFGADRNSSLTVGVNNILNDVRQEVYTGFRAEDQNFTRFNPGTSFSVGLKHSF
ncbi:MAG: TonB-dependent receptor [Cyclobacteriaceae bacterium]